MREMPSLEEAKRAENRGAAEIRHLYKPEPARRAWLGHEKALVNLTRKLSGEQRSAVYLLAESLVIGRIKASLERKRRASREARNG